MPALRGCEHESVVQQPSEMRRGGCRLDRGAVCEFLGGQRPSLHQQCQHANPCRIANCAGHAHHVGFYIHGLIETKLLARDKSRFLTVNERAGGFVPSLAMNATNYRDLTISLEHRPGALADVGEALGEAGVSVEGGGAWVVDGKGVAHFLVTDGSKARSTLEARGISVLAVREVLVQRLQQAVPGQLGKLSRRMADAGVNIEVLYSDHEHQLILVVDDHVRGQRVSDEWMREVAVNEAVA